MSTTTKSAAWHEIVAEQMRRSNDYAAAVEWADTCERNRAAAEAEREARAAALAAITDEQCDAICDEAKAAIAAHWPGVETVDIHLGAYACIRDEHASINVEWRPYDREWSANISEGTPGGGDWNVYGRASALAAVKSVRALVAAAAMDLREAADKTDALLAVPK